MDWSRIIRRVGAILVLSAFGALLAAAFAGESWTWSDRIGFSAFLVAIGALTTTMVWGHRLHQL